MGSIQLAKSVMRVGRKAAGTIASPILGPLSGSVVGVAGVPGTVVLTFDDGPDAHWTPQLLDVLDAHGASATFFMLGTAVRRAPHVAAQVARSGNEVALHGRDHRRPTTLSTAELTAALTQGRRELERATGKRVRWYRPPYGAQHRRSYRVARNCGLTPVMWSGTTWDWRDIPQDQRVAKAVATSGPGGILLAHDRQADVSDNAASERKVQVDRADLLDRVLGELAGRGLRAMSLGDVLAEGARPVLRPWFPRADLRDLIVRPFTEASGN